MFTRILAIGLISASLVASSHAQSVANSDKRAWLFDEYSIGIGNPYVRLLHNAEAQAREVKTRLTLYARELKRWNAQPYVISYSPRVVAYTGHSRSIASMRSSTVWPTLTGLGFDYRSITAVDGGFRESPSTELWIVPSGARSPQPTPTVDPRDVCYCPTASVSGVRYQPNSARELVFTARAIGGVAQRTPGFNWTVSSGQISNGAGTDTIRVSVPNDFQGNVVARVSLDGYSLECPVESSAAVGATTVNTRHFKFAELENPNCEYESFILDDLMMTMTADLSLEVQIVGYGPRRGRLGQALASATRLRNYLVNEKGLAATRIVLIDGGFRHNITVELWLSPVGALPPPLNSTMDRKFVTVLGTTPAKPSPCDMD